MTTFKKRTHYCGALRKDNAGSQVVLNGWVENLRDHGNLAFVDIRDRTGRTQVVFNPEVDKELHAAARELHPEYVISVEGKVIERPENLVNSNMPTGEIEIEANKLTVLSKAKTPPFEIVEETNANEDLRLKYRYLDLRRPSMQNAVETRHRVVLAARNYLSSKNFMEIETPILGRSTPEGARDYLVPSRTHQGKFFALPQSPQQYKQMLMVAGCDRYFQIAKCFRDEDQRADRQPEFTQIDIEMSFADQEEVFQVTEGLMKQMFREGIGCELSGPFPRLTYAESMKKYGTDKPDTRFPLELRELNDILADCPFKVFAEAIKNGGIVKAINAKGCAGYSRKQLDELNALAQHYGAKGAAWMKLTAEGFTGPIAKFFDETFSQKIRTAMEVEENDLLVFIADKTPLANSVMAAIRNKFGKEIYLSGEAERKFNFLWVTDFPLFQWNEEAQRYESEHHPFTSPNNEDIALLESDPLTVRSSSYDLVLNGNEVSSGSIRIHDGDLQKKIFQLLKISDEDIRTKFGYFVEALSYGTPPHAGIAPGLDRLVALMLGKESIRDIIAFPKTLRATCLMTEAPSEVSPEQLADLRIKVTKTDG